MTKKAVLIASIVLATALSAGAIAYVGYNRLNPQETASKSNKKPKPATAQSNSSSQTTDGEKPQESGGGEAVTYTNQRFGFRVDHRSDWPASQSQNGDGVTITVPGENGVTIRVYAYPTETYSLEQVVKDRENSERTNQPDLTVLEQRDVTVDDHPAIEVLWRTGSTKMRNVYSLKGSAVYSVECSAEEGIFDKYNEEFTKIIGSFKLK